jgi:preprotein translocase subunit SecB
MSNSTVSQQEVQKVVQASQLVAIHLKSCNSVCHVFPTAVEPHNTHLEINTSAAWNRTEQKDVLLCYIDVGAKGIAGKFNPAIKEGAPLFEARATIVAVYQLSEKSLIDEALEIFASQNALFNSYPFLREAISNLTAKMGIPPVLIPLLKLGTRIESNKSADSKAVS